MEKLSFKEKISYGAGDTASSIVWSTLMLFLANFYTDTYGLSPSVTGLIYVLVLFADSFIDIIAGMLSDRTSSRWGRYRPYLLFVSVPFGFFAAMLFYTPPLHGAWKTVYALVSFLLMMVAYSFINTPYSSLSSALSADPDERTGLMGFRFTGSYSGGLIVQAFMLPLVFWLGNGDENAGYFKTMIMLGSVSVIGFLITFRNTRERTSPLKSNSFRQDLKDLLANKPWLLLFAMSITMLFFFTMRNIILKYYFDYYVEQKEIMIPLLNIKWQALSAFYIAGTLSILVSVILTGILSRMVGKKRLFTICNMLVIVTLAGFYSLKPGNTGLIFMFHAAYCFFVGPMIPLLWSMYTDTIDYSEWKCGRRATGLVISASLFANKNGFAFGSLTTMLLLSLSGYIPNAVQSAAVINTMKFLISFCPAIGACITLVLIRYYRLNESMMKKIKEDLSKRKLLN